MYIAIGPYLFYTRIRTKLSTVLVRTSTRILIPRYSSLKLNLVGTAR